ncbi:helix-turn-helix transcriptional regulator [Streptoverticillium reticulum]|uniref:helix-turn-helix transcriptional regulator n=1 Tax=Streptoverticillium reticulum TaxID=1433415 RepID=UPI0039BF08B6
MPEKRKSGPGAEWLHRALPAMAADPTTVPELAGELSRLVGQLIPHDGYMLAGLDPSCFYHRRNGYRPDTSRHLDRSHAIMPTEGTDSEIRIALTLGGVPWGGLTLLRELGNRPFSETDATHAERLADSLAAALKRFVAARPLRPSRHSLPPGLVVIGADDKIQAITPSARAWLGQFMPGALLASDEELIHRLWDITCSARCSNHPVLRCVPTPDGWIAVHAQFLNNNDNNGEGEGEGDPGTERRVVAITFQSAPATLLLSTVSAWYGLTPREQVVVGHLLQGLPIKGIARVLDRSPHTVIEHLRSIYRKTGTAGREELVASLIH